MKFWVDDFRSRCGAHLGVKLIKEYLDVEDILLEVNEELFIELVCLKRIILMLKATDCEINLMQIITHNSYH